MRRLIVVLVAASLAAPIAHRAVAAPPGQSGSGPGGWAAPPTGISGTARYDGGEWVYQDFVYDDGEQADNTADIVEVRVRRGAPRSAGLRVRVILNSLRDAGSTVIGVAAAGDEAPVREWPHQAGVSSPWDLFVTVAGGAVRVDDAADRADGADGSAAIDGGAAATDLAENTVEFTVPLPGGTGDPGAPVTLNVGAGAWDAAGDRWSAETGVVDLAFNTEELEPIGDDFRSAAQQDAIDSGDVSAYAQPIDGKALASRRTDPPVDEPGFHNRVYPSRQDLGEGYDPDGEFPMYRGLYQPYALWIPSDYDSAEPTPLVLVLHSLGQVHNQYDTWDVWPEVAEPLGALAITPLALGDDGWYWDEALVDTLDAWTDTERHYNVDRERTYSTGYSMGGYATYRLTTLLPDRFASAVSWVGPPAHQLWAYPANPVPSGPRREPGNTWFQLENTRHIPFFIVHGTNDELVPLSGVTHTAERFHELGHTYRYNLHPGQDHFTFAVLDDWTREAVWLGSHPARVAAPARVTYKVRPQSWVTPGRDDDETILRHLRALAAELGTSFDSAYWVRDVRPAGDGDVTGFVDLTSSGIPARDSRVEEVHTVGTASSPHVVRGLDRTDGPLPTANVLEGHLTGVSELTVDLAAAGLSIDGVDVRVTTDTPTLLHLVDGDRTGTVVLSPS